MTWSDLSSPQGSQGAVPTSWPRRSRKAAFGYFSRRLLFAVLAGLVVCYVIRWQLLTERTPSTRPDTFTLESLGLSKSDIGMARANPTAPVGASPFRFVDIAVTAGVNFVHESGMTEAKHFPTAYGSGVAVFDADGDGNLDLYFANATFLPVGTVKTGPNRFFRNTGNGEFRDMTGWSGLGFTGYCQGIAVGDIDNDGDQDVFLCNYGGNVLYRNKGNGKFEDVTTRAHVDQTGWSTSAAFLDYDGDGKLDLYVVNYGRWRLPENDLVCVGAPGPFAENPPQARIYCSPKSIEPAPPYLYHNNGDGTFSEKAEAAGVRRIDGRGLGVVSADLNDDGRTDLYVVNDMCPNFVFINRGGGRFDDATEISGAGYDLQGATRAGMGVDAEDINGDGRPDLFVTNYWNEPNSVFVGMGEGRFEERSRGSGLMHDSLLWVGWGCTLTDFDNDGWPDCFVANGNVDDNLEQIGHTNPYAQPALLHRNLGQGRFESWPRERRGPTSTLTTSAAAWLAAILITMAMPTSSLTIKGARPRSSATTPKTTTVGFASALKGLAQTAMASAPELRSTLGIAWCSVSARGAQATPRLMTRECLLVLARRRWLGRSSSNGLPVKSIVVSRFPPAPIW